MHEFNMSKDQEQRAKDLHKKAIIIDGLVPKGGLGLDYPKNRERFLVGGITAINCTVAHFPENFQRALKEVDKYKQGILTSDYLLFADSVDDIKRAKKEEKVGTILGFQDGRPIEDDLAHLRTIKDVGVRIIQLTYNNLNLIGVGCAERFYGGLSHFGIEVVREMNRLGIVVDLSHCCDETTMDAVEVSKDPVLFTHSGVRSLCNSYGRNKTDEQIKALAEKGGVIGIGWLPMCIKQDPKTHEVQRATIDDVLNHIEYVAKLVGVDHVGFGSDTDGKVLDGETIPWYSSLRMWRPLRPDVFGAGSTEIYEPNPVGLERHSETPNLTRGLVARGYSDQEILKILGGNFLRVFERVWKD